MRKKTMASPGKKVLKMLRSQLTGWGVISVFGGGEGKVGSPGSHRKRVGNCMGRRRGRLIDSQNGLTCGVEVNVAESAKRKDTMFGEIDSREGASLSTNGGKEKGRGCVMPGLEKKNQIIKTIKGKTGKRSGGTAVES